MDKYLTQLLADIANATANVQSPYPERESPVELWEWIPDEEEDQTATRRQLEDWTGIRKAQLPPENQLTDEQILLLFGALKKMLHEYNWMFVLQIQVPERIQYRALRDNFDQEAICKRWHMGFFELCKKGTPHGECGLGEYCHCQFFADMFAHMSDEELSPEEERRRHLEIEVQHIKRKYGDDYMKYYPYHLDAEYDDENGNPYDYGFGEDSDEEEEDDWWRK
jgi:hypothetical protein